MSTVKVELKRPLTEGNTVFPIGHVKEFHADDAERLISTGAVVKTDKALSKSDEPEANKAEPVVSIANKAEEAPKNKAPAKKGK